MHTQVHNYSIRYLNSEGPLQSNYWVRRALTDKRANWLQNSFVDSVQALGGRCNGFGPWNPCKVAFCDDMKPFLHQIADSWGPNISPVVHQWLTGPRSRGELRNFARTLIPVSLYELLTASRELKHQVYESLPTRRKALSSTIKSAYKHRRDRPLPEPLPPPLSHNSFFESRGPYSTSDRDPTQKSHLYRPPSPIPSVVSLRGTDTSRGVKRKRTRDPPGPAPKRSCSQHNREKRRQVSINQFLPHGPP